jgi:glycosyltransferase involved in cell wall biosynthesis
MSSGGVHLLSCITPVILTFNEAPNISRVLDRLSWAKNIVIVDSGSQDGTQNKISRYPNTQIFERTFDSHVNQWNFALLETGIRSEWVLALDADHIMTEELIREVSTLTPREEESGFRIAFTYCVLGHPLRASLYPPLISIYRRERAYYIQHGHTQRIVVEGVVRSLQSHLLHDDRKPIGRWLKSQNRYMRLEAALIRESSWGNLSWPNRLRKFVLFAPFVTFLWCFLVKRTIFDGIPGMYYTAQRTAAECILSLHLLAQLHRWPRS